MVVVVWQNRDTLHGFIEIVDPPAVGGTDTDARPSLVDRIIAVFVQNNDSETEADTVYERELH